MDESLIKKRFCEELKCCGLSNAEIARLINVSPKMVTQYKTTKKLPKLETFAKIRKALDLDVNYILGNQK